MFRTIEYRSPQWGVAVAALFAVATLCIDAYDARPVIQRWLAAEAQSPVAISTESHATTFGALNVAIETSSGARTTLAATGGRVRIATMFYAHCPTMCPMTVDAIQRIDSGLTATERANLSVLLLSLDPSRDSPSTLRDFASTRRIDSQRWTLARTAASDVSTVARSLGISYGPSSAGVLDHKPALVLIDSQGRELARTETVAAPDRNFLAAVRRALATSARS